MTCKVADFHVRPSSFETNWDRSISRIPFACASVRIFELRSGMRELSEPGRRGGRVVIISRFGASPREIHSSIMISRLFLIAVVETPSPMSLVPIDMYPKSELRGLKACTR